MAASTRSAPPVATAPAEPVAPRRTQHGPVSRGHGRAWPRHAAPAVLLAALGLVCAFAAFDGGGTGPLSEGRVGVALAVVALAALVAGAGAGVLRLATSRLGWLGVGLLAGFASWAAISLSWSVAPDGTWAQVNRALAALLALGLAVAVGSSLRRARSLTASGLLGLSVLVALYALGGKTFPDVSLLGLDLDHTSLFARLRAPLEYWNALALMCVLGAAPAVRLAADPGRATQVRLAALAALWLLVVTLGLTYSRGGLVALAVAVGVATWLGAFRLRGLVALAIAFAAALPGIAFAFARPALTANGAPLGARVDDGRVLAVVLLGCLVAVLVLGWALVRLEPRLRWSARRSRVVWRVAGSLAGVAALLGAVAVLSAPGGLGRFTEVQRAPSTSDPERLLSANSGNRWVWWKEAVGAWSDRPVGGWGAGSFPVTHLRYRDIPLPVRQPHSLPLQLLAETGVVGFLLGMGAIGALLWAALARIRSLPQGRERDLGAALVGAGAAWAAHSCVDWHWDVPGVTLPAMVALGVAVARGPDDAPVRASSRAPAVALVVGAVALTAVAASAALPALSASRTSEALRAAGDGASPAALERAATDAQLAARLDPASVEPLFAGATIAQRRGRVLEQRRLLLDAVRRQPSSADAWAKLAGVALVLGDRRGLASAARRALALDPRNPQLIQLVSVSELFLAPPQASPTAGGTPFGATGEATPTPDIATPPAAAVTPTPATTTPGATAAPATTTPAPATSPTTTPAAPAAPTPTPAP